MSIDELSIANKDLQKANKDLESNIIALQGVLQVKEDVENQLATAMEHNQQIDAAKDELNKEMEAASDYIANLEDKFFEAKKK